MIMQFLIPDLESKLKMYFGSTTERRYPDEDMHWKEGHIAEHTLQSHTTTEKDIEKKLDDDLASGNENNMRIKY